MEHGVQLITITILYPPVDSIERQANVFVNALLDEGESSCGSRDSPYISRRNVHRKDPDAGGFEGQSCPEKVERARYEQNRLHIPLMEKPCRVDGALMCSHRFFVDN